MRRKPIRTSVGDPCGATSSFATLNCPVEALEQHSEALDVGEDAFDDDDDDPYDPTEFIVDEDD